MGTNYYIEAKPPCECCGRPFEQQHIGKSSVGWCFTLHVDGIHRDLPDWIAEWSKQGSIIVDEYGSAIPPDEMLETITTRARESRPMSKTEMDRNQAIAGPNGLLRLRIDGQHCIGHGSGTWDMCPGEFS